MPHLFHVHNRFTVRQGRSWQAHEYTKGGEQLFSNKTSLAEPFRQLLDHLTWWLGECEHAAKAGTQGKKLAVEALIVMLAR